MKVSLATKNWDSTNINLLRVHAINPGTNRAECNSSLKPMFDQQGTVEDLTCYSCAKKVNPLAINPFRVARIERVA